MKTVTIQVPMDHGDGAYICEEPVRRFARICCGEAASVVGETILSSFLLARSLVCRLSHAVDNYVRAPINNYIDKHLRDWQEILATGKSVALLW